MIRPVRLSPGCCSFGSISNTVGVPCKLKRRNSSMPDFAFCAAWAGVAGVMGSVGAGDFDSAEESGGGWSCSGMGGKGKPEALEDGAARFVSDSILTVPGCMPATMVGGELCGGEDMSTETERTEDDDATGVRSKGSRTAKSISGEQYDADQSKRDMVCMNLRLFSLIESSFFWCGLLAHAQ
jgi:hypothetical protein